MPWPFKKRKLTMTNAELAHYTKIRKMRTALYDMLWAEIQKDARFPRPYPQTSGTDEMIKNDLREIILGEGE